METLCLLIPKRGMSSFRGCLLIARLGSVVDVPSSFLVAARVYVSPLLSMSMLSMLSSGVYCTSDVRDRAMYMEVSCMSQ